MGLQIYLIRASLQKIRKMALYECNVNVMRNGRRQILNGVGSRLLVPGDVIEVPENCVLPCDLILLSGSCIVNESMLTGESVPVIKSSIPSSNDMFDYEYDQKYILYGGSKVIQNKQYGNDKTSALVIRTGFHTTKGDLVREIMYPKENKFKFWRDAMKVIAVQPFIGLFGLIPSLNYFIS